MHPYMEPVKPQLLIIVYGATFWPREKVSGVGGGWFSRWFFDVGFGVPLLSDIISRSYEFHLFVYSV